MINNISLFDSVNMLCKNKYLGELFELRGHDRPCLPDLDNASGGNNDKIYKFQYKLSSNFKFFVS